MFGFAFGGLFLVAWIADKILSRPPRRPMPDPSRAPAWVRLGAIHEKRKALETQRKEFLDRIRGELGSAQETYLKDITTKLTTLADEEAAILAEEDYFERKAEAEAGES
jgi:hypothetical protein